MYGYPERSAKKWDFSARCVRGAPVDAKLTVSGDGLTAFDAATGLVWQREAILADWQGALAYCSNLNLVGHDDWRLPTIKELWTIVDDTSPTGFIDENVFGPSTAYAWSSSPIPNPAGPGANKGAAPPTLPMVATPARPGQAGTKEGLIVRLGTS